MKLSDKSWSPYVAGVIIGLLQIPAFMLINTALGTSSSYVTLSGTLASFVDPGITQIDYVAKHLSGAKNWWQVATVVGIAIGAFISSRWSGTARRSISPIWKTALGTTSLGLRLLLAFVSGFMLLLGARIADGCTSGHGISGMAQLAISSFVTVACMFAGGMIVALFLRKV
ncbi:MAG: YeeE/YedE thiosulfate transporter family protein [Betaproteobacteria bacterium]